MRNLLRSLLLSAVAATLATSASAQGFSIHVDGGYQDLTLAKDSAKAVFDGSSGGFTWGGGLGFSFGALYIDASARSFSKDGERVYVESAAGPVFPLGHPLTLKMQPILGTIGYRFLRDSSFRPYVGIGGGMVLIKESSVVGGVAEHDDRNKGAFQALAGVEFGRGTLGFAGEVSYLSIPNSAGVGGVSKVYGEENLGGVTAVGKLIFRFGH